MEDDQVVLLQSALGRAQTRARQQGRVVSEYEQGLDTVTQRCAAQLFRAEQTCRAARDALVAAQRATPRDDGAVAAAATLVRDAEAALAQKRSMLQSVGELVTPMYAVRRRSAPPAETFAWDESGGSVVDVTPHGTVDLPPAWLAHATDASSVLSHSFELVGDDAAERAATMEFVSRTSQHLARQMTAQLQDRIDEADARRHAAEARAEQLAGDTAAARHTANTARADLVAEREARVAEKQAMHARVEEALAAARSERARADAATERAAKLEGAVQALEARLAREQAARAHELRELEALRCSAESDDAGDAYPWLTRAHLAWTRVLVWFAAFFKGLFWSDALSKTLFARLLMLGGVVVK